jgi:hypothetical protein
MYNKETFAQTAARLGWKSGRRKLPQRRAISTGEIIGQFLEHGYAIIPLRDVDAVRSRCKRENYHWSFVKISGREAKVTPKQE